MNPIKKVYRLKQAVKNPTPDRRTKDVAWAVPEWKEGQLFLATTWLEDHSFKDQEIKVERTTWEARGMHGQLTKEQSEFLMPYLEEVNLGQGQSNRPLLYKALKMYHNWNDSDMLRFIFLNIFEIRNNL
jgi:hypothetical protein